MKNGLKYFWLVTFLIVGILFIFNTELMVMWVGKALGLLLGILVIGVLTKDVVNKVLSLINRNKK